MAPDRSPRPAGGAGQPPGRRVPLRAAARGCRPATEQPGRNGLVRSWFLRDGDEDQTVRWIEQALGDALHARRGHRLMTRDIGRKVVGIADIMIVPVEPIGSIEHLLLAL